MLDSSVQTDESMESMGIRHIVPESRCALAGLIPVCLSAMQQSIALERLTYYWSVEDFLQPGCQSRYLPRVSNEEWPIAGFMRSLRKTRDPSRAEEYLS
jgi:hypothetical protein